MPQQSFIPDDMQVHKILEPTEDEKWLGALPQVLKVFKKSAPEQKCKRTAEVAELDKKREGNPLFTFFWTVSKGRCT